MLPFRWLRLLKTRFAVSIPDSNPEEVRRVLLQDAGIESVEPRAQWGLWIGLPSRSVIFRKCQQRGNLIASHSLNRGDLRIVLRLLDHAPGGTLVRGRPADSLVLVAIVLTLWCLWLLWLLPHTPAAWAMVLMAPFGMLGYVQRAASLCNTTVETIQSVYPDCKLSE